MPNHPRILNVPPAGAGSLVRYGDVQRPEENSDGATEDVDWISEDANPDEGGPQGSEQHGKRQSQYPHRR
jgi:hypothetical protein